MKLLLSQLNENEKNMRRKGATYETYIESLMESLQIAGQRVPLTVVENEDGTYTVHDGNCRLDAMRRLDWEDCDAVVSDGLNFGAEALATQVRKDFNDTERMSAVQLAIFGGITADQISAASGMTKKAVNKLWKAAKTRDKLAVPEATIEDLEFLAKVEKTCGEEAAQECAELIGTEQFNYTCQNFLSKAKKEKLTEKFTAWVAEQEEWKALEQRLNKPKEESFYSCALDYCMSKRFKMPEGAVAWFFSSFGVSFVKVKDGSNTDQTGTIDNPVVVEDSPVNEDKTELDPVMVEIYENCMELRNEFAKNVSVPKIKANQDRILRTFLETCIMSPDVEALFKDWNIESAESGMFLVWDIVYFAHNTFRREDNENSEMDSWGILYDLLCDVGYKISPVESALLDNDFAMAVTMHSGQEPEPEPVKEKESAVVYDGEAVDIADLEEFL